MWKYFLFLGIFANLSLIHGFNEQRIGGSEITPPDLFQFTIRAGCTTSVISKRHLLDAAHCLFRGETRIEMHDTYKIYWDAPYYAEVRSTREGVNRSIVPVSKKVYVPKNYVIPNNTYDDIAVLEFPEGTDFGVEPVKLARDYFEKEGDESYIVGFGVWWENGSVTSGGSDVLRHAKVTMVENCWGTLRICGGNRTHRAFVGDSGGPMVINRNNQWYQIGVSAGTASMDFRARISSYCNFIEEVTKNEAKCESIFPNNNHNITPKQFPPLYKGQETPIKLFDFVIPFYSYYFGHECTATVISKRYLLTSAFCVHQTNEESRLTQFSTYKTISGNFFPDFRSKSGIHSNIVEPVNVTAYIPLNYDWPWRHNLAVVEFPEGTDFGVEPITLAKDYIQIYLDYAIIAEYGKYEIKKNMHINGSSPIMKHSSASFETPHHEKYLIYANISLTEGSATLIEKNGKFYQFAVNYLHGTPDGAAANVAGDCNFIQEVTKNEVICESTAPIYEMPFESTTFLPQPNQENNAKSEPLTAAAAPSIIGFQMGFLINFLALLFHL